MLRGVSDTPFGVNTGTHIKPFPYGLQFTESILTLREVPPTKSQKSLVFRGSKAEKGQSLPRRKFGVHPRAKSAFYALRRRRFETLEATLETGPKPSQTAEIGPNALGPEPAEPRKPRKPRKPKKKIEKCTECNSPGPFWTVLAGSRMPFYQNSNLRGDKRGKNRSKFSKPLRGRKTSLSVCD